jgi:alcohol dehydrogenase class IV
LSADPKRLNDLAAIASVAVAAILVSAKLAIWIATGSVAILGSLVDSGMDALANCIEAYFSTWASPLTDALALHATRLIADSLRAAVANGRNLEARQNMALAAFEAGLIY